MPPANINTQFRPLKLNSPFQYNMGVQQPEEEAKTPAPVAPAPTTAPAPTSGYQWKLPQTMLQATKNLNNPNQKHSLMTDVGNILRGSWDTAKAATQDAIHIGQDVGRSVVNNAVIPAANYVAGTDIKPISTPSTPAPASPATPATPAPYTPGDIIGSPMPDPSKIKPIRAEASGADFAHGGMLPQNVKREENGTYTRSIYDDAGQYKGWVNQKSVPDNMTITSKTPEQPATPTESGGLKNTMFANQQEIEQRKKAAQAGTYGSTSPGSSGLS
jgi:hypothetical protein